MAITVDCLALRPALSITDQSRIRMSIRDLGFRRLGGDHQAAPITFATTKPVKTRAMLWRASYFRVARRRVANATRWIPPLRKWPLRQRNFADRPFARVFSRRGLSGKPNWETAS